MGGSVGVFVWVDVSLIGQSVESFVSGNCSGVQLVDSLLQRLGLVVAFLKEEGLAVELALQLSRLRIEAVEVLPVGIQLLQLVYAQT